MGKIIRDISYYYDGKKYIDILYDSFDKSIKKEYSRDNNLQFLTDQINGNGSRIKYEKDGITEFKDDSKDYDMDFSVGSGNDNDPNHDMLYYSNYQLQFERYLNRNPIVIKQYAKNGVPSIDYEVSYENDNVKNIGYYKSYHGNGQLSFETTYNEDEKENGIHRTYYKNAVLESEKYYENGILKTEKTYYENGLLKSEYAGGTKQHTEYDEHGEKIKIEQTASNTSNISEPINFPTREEVQSMQRQEKTSEIGEKIIYYITIAIMTIVIGILMKRIYNSKKNNKFNQGKKNKNNNKKKF
jgi:antitoxin component YwqK of YwqJK toxin-antitoxin module